MGESFENLKAWQKAHELMMFVHQVDCAFAAKGREMGFGRSDSALKQERWSQHRRRLWALLLQRPRALLLQCARLIE